MQKVISKPDFDAIAQNLCSLEVDWKKREESLVTLSKNLGHTSYQKQAFDFVQSLPRQLAVQHSDLRSAIVKLASEVVQEASRLTRKYKNIKMNRFSECLLKETSFLKALGSGNKVIAKHAQSALQALSANNCIDFESIVQFYSLNHANKIISIRERVAETVLAFMKSTIHPPKAPAINLFSGQDFGECLENSGLQTAPDETADSQPQPKFQSLLSRAKTAKKINPKAFAIEKPKTQKTLPESNKRKMTIDDLRFFVEACETLSKDAAAAVRNTAKEMRKEMANLEEVLIAMFEEKETNISNETAEEHEYRQRFVSNERRDKLKHTANFQSTRPQLNRTMISPFPDHLIQPPPANRPQKQKMLIEPPTEPVQQPKASPLEKILTIVADHQMQSKEKVEKIAELISHHSPISFTPGEYVELIQIADSTKSNDVRNQIVKLLMSADINYVKTEVLFSLAKRKMVKKANLQALITHIISQTAQIDLINLFVSDDGGELAGFLDRHAKPSELELIFQSSSVLAEKSLAKIVQNILACNGETNFSSKFESENFCLLEKLLKIPKFATVCSNYNFNPLFMECARKTHPMLYKFLLQSKQQRIFNSDFGKAGSKGITCLKQIKEETDSQRTSLSRRKSSQGSRKCLLKAISDNLGQLDSKEITPMNKVKIFTKTIDLLTATTDSLEANDCEVLASVYGIIAQMMALPLESHQKPFLYETTIRLSQAHFYRFPTEIAEHLVMLMIGDPLFFQFVCQKAFDEIAMTPKHDLLRLTTSVLQTASISSLKSTFIDAIRPFVDGLVLDIRLTGVTHERVGVRMESINSLVEIFKMLDPESVAQLRKDFSAEQQSLIESVASKQLS